MDNYEQFKRDVFSITRIDLNAYKERQMRRRIDALIEKHKIISYADYVRSLRLDNAMLEEFVNYLTINVSEFYRNPDLWQVLETEILPLLLEKTKVPKIWSAACSTGDEPYSLVMLLHQFLPYSSIHIIATDIDKQVLEAAELGLYHDKSLQSLTATFKNRYFTKITDTSYQVIPEVKACVEFRRHNLLKDAYPFGCDLIVCRNVLIYFTEEAKDDIFKKFNAALAPSGFLFVGATEQMLHPVDIGYQAFRSFFYRKG